MTKHKTIVVIKTKETSLILLTGGTHLKGTVQNPRTAVSNEYNAELHFIQCKLCPVCMPNYSLFGTILGDQTSKIP